MRIKLLVVLCLSTFLFLAACGKNENKNANSNAVVVATATPLPKTSETAAVDNTLKTKIEDALKKKGFTTVTVDASTTPATLRGTYPKGKLDEVIQTAQEAAGKPVKNEMAEAK
jgi:hypothetical protein